MKPEPENNGNGPKRGRPRALLIAGPTASGKSALAMALARKLGGEIINADSMQVYSILRVLTARPTAEEEALVPHHLYGVLDPSEVCSAQVWAEMAMTKVEEIEARGAFPILVGGTGLYFKALTAGLSPMPPVPEEIRAAVRAEVAADAGAAHAALEKIDPEAAARIGPADGQRIARALEIYRATGKKLTWWQGHAPAPLLTGPLAKFVLDPPRDWLRARIDTRFDMMIGEGVLEEVRALAARELDPQLPAMKALGVPSLMAHLTGEKSLEEAISEAKTLTKQFAKRQGTWFRHQMIAWERPSAQEMESRIQEIFSFIDDYGLTTPC